MPITHLDRKEFHVGDESFEDSWIRNELRAYLGNPKEDLMFYWDREKSCNNPNGYIVVNGEPLFGGSGKLDEGYKKFLDGAVTVLDYSERNIQEIYPRAELFKWLPNKDSKHHNIDKEIDILFYGHMNERRERIIDKLEKVYPKVVCCNRFPMSELKEYIKKTKWVLSIRSYDEAPNDSFRTTPALNMGANILTETYADEWYMDNLRLHFQDRVRVLHDDEIQ